jgi:hypothetical protein
MIGRPPGRGAPTAASTSITSNHLLAAQQALPVQQSLSGQHVAAAARSQHGPPGQQIPSGQQDFAATLFAAVQQGPSGQQDPSGQHANTLGPAFWTGTASAPLHAEVLRNATATKAASANNFEPMIRFSKMDIGLVCNDYAESAGRRVRLIRARR